MATSEYELMPGVNVVPQRKPEPAKPAAAAPAAPTDPVPVPTAEELKQRAIDLYSTLGWGAPPEDVVVKPATTPADSPPAEPAAAPAVPAAPTEVPATPPAAAAPPAQPEPEPQQPPSTAEIIARSARETAREIARELKPSQPPAAAPAPGIDLTEQDSADLKVINYLERTDPQYKGATQAFLDYVKANYAYQAQWLKDNPDKQFNPEEEEHKAWYDQHDPGIEAEALDQAKIDMMVEEKVEAKLEPKIQAEKAQRAWQEALPGIAGQVNKAVFKMVKAVDEGLATILSENPTTETIQKLEDADPIAKEVLDEISRTSLEAQVLELEKTTIPDLNFRLDPQSNPVHAEIAHFVREKEHDLMAAPAEARENNGKQFISLGDYARRANQINQDRNLSEADKSQRMADMDATYWTLSVDMIEELLADSAAKKASTIIQKRNNLAKKKFGTAPPSAAAPAPAAPTAPPAAAVPSALPAGFRARPPSGGGGADVVTGATPGGNSNNNPSDIALQVAFPR